MSDLQKTIRTDRTNGFIRPAFPLNHTECRALRRIRLTNKRLCRLGRRVLGRVWFQIRGTNQFRRATHRLFSLGRRRILFEIIIQLAHTRRRSLVEATRLLLLRAKARARLAAGLLVDFLQLHLLQAGQRFTITALQRVGKGGAIGLDPLFDLFKKLLFPIGQRRAEALLSQGRRFPQLAERRTFLAFVDISAHERRIW